MKKRRKLHSRQGRARKLYSYFGGSVGEGTSSGIISPIRGDKGIQKGRYFSLTGNGRYGASNQKGSDDTLSKRGAKDTMVQYFKSGAITEHDAKQ